MLMFELNLDKTEEVLREESLKKINKKLLRIHRLGIKPERLQGETFKDYKLRQRIAKQQVKKYLKGKVLYPGMVYKEIEGKVFLVSNRPFVKARDGYLTPESERQHNKFKK